MSGICLSDSSFVHAFVFLLAQMFETFYHKQKQRFVVFLTVQECEYD